MLIGRPSSKRFVKSNEVIQFKNFTKNADRYEWNFGDGEFSTLESPEHSFKNKGEYKISLKAYSGEKYSELDTLLRCDMTASLTFTFFCSEYTPLSHWPQLLYTVHYVSLFDSKSPSTALKSWQSPHEPVYDFKNYVLTVPFDNENIKYTLRMIANIGGTTTGPDPNADYFISAPLGNYTTDTFSVYNGIPPNLVYSKKFKFMTLNYKVSPLQYF